jgi:hypothetical protein
MLDKADTEADFRVLWVASVALCRSIGHALHNSGNQSVKYSSERRYAEWKEDKNGIFSSFIEKERNNVLKEHRSSFDADATFAPLSINGFLIDNDWFYVPFVDDKFGDIDVRDKLLEARDWWFEQLASIEAEL